VFAAGGVPYLVDLQNEDAAIATDPAQMQLLAFDQQLWSDYTSTYGKADTVGFSTIADASRIASLAADYGGNLPDVLDLHFYGKPFTQEDTGGIVTDTHGELRAEGMDEPWIIGETFYDDASTAAQLGAAIASTGQQVDALYQWPVDRADRTDQYGNQGVDVAPPIGFANYLPLVGGAATSVPEPGSLAMVAAAISGLAALRAARGAVPRTARTQVTKRRISPARGRCG
jgi:hypothetical protein